MVIPVHLFSESIGASQTKEIYLSLEMLHVIQRSLLDRNTPHEALEVCMTVLRIRSWVHQAT